jgi:hypothetical protein
MNVVPGEGRGPSTDQGPSAAPSQYARKEPGPHRSGSVSPHGVGFVVRSTSAKEIVMKVKTQIKAGAITHNHNEVLARAERDLTVRNGVQAFSTPPILVGPSTASHPSFDGCCPDKHSPSTAVSAQSPGGRSTSCIPSW